MAAEAAWRTAGSRMPTACRVQPPVTSSSSAWEWIATSLRPPSSESRTTCTRTPEAAEGRTSGASMTSSASLAAPISSPARIAISTSAVPGTITRPATTWSASQGWELRPRRPVRIRPPLAARLTVAPSSGCPATDWPRPVTSVRPATGLSQNRCRSKAYVGRSTRRAPLPS